MKTNFLESIGSALFAVIGPVHDAILKGGKPDSAYLGSSGLTEWKKSEDAESALPDGVGPYPVKTLFAYVGGTALVCVLVSLLACGQFKKKRKPVRRRRAATKTRRRTYKRRR